MRVSMNGRVLGATKKAPKKCHEIKRISTFASSKNNSDIAKDEKIFSLPAITI